MPGIARKPLFGLAATRIQPPQHPVGEGGGGTRLCAAFDDGLSGGGQQLVLNVIDRDRVAGAVSHAVVAAVGGETDRVPHAVGVLPRLLDDLVFNVTAVVEFVEAL